jgi:preprotein translocase subunit SecG
MVFIIGLFTVVMVLDCLILVFLVLIQLPKKDAGAGLAFGAGATDALFGAGSGTVLTKITKYAATIFFILAIVLSVMQNQYHRRSAKLFNCKLSQPGAPAPTAIPATIPPATAPAAVTSTNTARTNGFELESATNPPVASPPATNTP